MTRQRIATASLFVVLLTGCGDTPSDARGGSASAAETESGADEGGDGGGGSQGDDGTDGSVPAPKADLGVDPPEACDRYCVVVSECLGQTATDCLLSCNADHEAAAAVTETCVTAHDAVLSCVAELSCADVGAFNAAVGDYPCAQADLDRAVACADPGASMPACVDFCATSQTCDATDPAACQVQCNAAVAAALETDAACADAQVAVFACAAALTCKAYAQWTAADGEYQCRAQDAALLDACDPT